MSALSTAEFDAFVEGLDYPVFVVTTSDGRERAGCLVGFATQVSIDPPRLLVCLSEANHTLGVAAGADVLAVHVLDSSEHPLAAHFGGETGGETGDEVDKFATIRWHAGPHGVPLLDDVPRYLVGEILERIPFGDHVGHLLCPIDEHDEHDGPHDDADPLSFHDVEDVEPGHPAG